MGIFLMFFIANKYNIRKIIFQLNALFFIYYKIVLRFYKNLL
ncbi:hypothetical protein TPE_0959 [Treponema pedis str. T A4]|uniref:Uncharacterized protein n=1 Tax=Treponema pedis str. T A4 TaxID=1291379 RepID=S5ZTJ0_9SPIR|nr:hypothetical protein TPE_0959 [Treponema pedis str. T A4]